jgi:hypothetical protein
LSSEAEKINVKKLEDNEETAAREPVENQRGTRRMEILRMRRRTVDCTFLVVVSWTTFNTYDLRRLGQENDFDKGVVVVVKINIFNLCFEGFCLRKGAEH